jgi:hypothetical protein
VHSSEVGDGESSRVRTLRRRGQFEKRVCKFGTEEKSRLLVLESKKWKTIRS